MKKLTRVLTAVLVLMLCLGCLGGAALAAEPIRVEVPKGIDFVDVDFSESLGYPYVCEDGTVMLPLRAVAEALKLAVSWDGSAHSAVLTKNGSQGPELILSFPIGECAYTSTTIGLDFATMQPVNTVTQHELSHVVETRGGRTYVAAEDLVAAAGYVAAWDADQNALTIRNDWDEKTQGYMELYYSEYEQARYIVNRPHAYESTGFEAYLNLFDAVYWLVRGSVVTDETVGMIYALKGAREALVQVEDPEAGIWYIWGEDMPEAADADSYDYTDAFDNEGFKPFLVPYLLKNQSEVKGNVIVIAGGGYALRSNAYEGYPVAERFNELGYNAFVLQRRVAPSTALDAHLDLQRAIRYIRYYADELGIAQTDKVAACGFSGGGMTVQGAVADCYGSILPTAFYPDYQCDAVDQVNSDMQTAILIYGANALETENPNLPDVFFAVGEKDDKVSLATQIAAIQSYEQLGLRYEAHILADAPHGFGSGWGLNVNTYTMERFTAAAAWMDLADTFMQIQFGYLPQSAPLQ